MPIFQVPATQTGGMDQQQECKVIFLQALRLDALSHKMCGLLAFGTLASYTRTKIDVI